MPILALSTNASISAWETSTTNVDLLVDGVPLSGVAAAAYLYGQALTTLSFERTEETVAGQTVLLIGNGVQLADARFQFPPAPAPAPGPDDRPWVSLTEVADALRYKYGVDPLIEFSPGLGSRGYSIPDINRILELLNREFAGQFSLPLIASAAVLAATQRTAAASGVAYNATAVATLLNTASTNLLTPATSAELHEQLTEGGDIYVDRNGAFYINGIRTRAMDLAVTSRVLVQENLSAEYKAMMDDLAERNNLIAAARAATDNLNLSAGQPKAARAESLLNTVTDLNTRYGMTDSISVLTGGQVTMESLDPAAFRPKVQALVDYLDGIDLRAAALGDFYVAQRANAIVRQSRYLGEFGSDNASYKKVTKTIARFDDYITEINKAKAAIDRLQIKADEDLVGGGFNKIPAAIVEEQKLSGESDVFAWLRNFDVDPSYLWASNQDMFKFVGESYQYDYELEKWIAFDENNPLLQHTLVAGGPAVLPLVGFPGVIEYPSINFSWTTDDWGYLSRLGSFGMTQAEVELYGISISPDGSLTWYDDRFVQWAKQVMEGALPSLGFNPDAEAYVRDEDGELLSSGFNNDYVSASGEIQKYDLSSYFGGDRFKETASASLRKFLEWAELSYGEMELQTKDKYTDYSTYPYPEVNVDDREKSWKLSMAANFEPLTYGAEPPGDLFAVFDWGRWKASNETAGDRITSLSMDAALGFTDAELLRDEFAEIAALLSTLISNKVRDGDLDQAKLQAITGQLQNNTEAMTALIKAFSDLNAALVQALR